MNSSFGSSFESSFSSDSGSNDGSTFCENLNQMHMSLKDLGKFRTSYCEKKYVHDHDVCAFAHDTVNNGWLRRNPFEHNYKSEWCPKVVKSSGGHIINSCELGVRCKLCHSWEEIDYHIDNYKKGVCADGGACEKVDVCPNLHGVGGLGGGLGLGGGGGGGGGGQRREAGGE